MKILLIAYDNGSHLNLFPIGIGYIASVLLKKGHKVVIYNQDIYHHSPKHLTDFLDNHNFDAVGMGVVGGYYQYKKLLEISNAINNSKKRPLYIIGGYGPTPEPEFFLKKTRADIVVMGEGEDTIVELFSGKNLYDVNGIAFRDQNEIVINERRKLIRDLDSIPFPAYELFPMEIYRLKRVPNTTLTDFVVPMVSGRGCKFKCNFCYRMDKGARERSNEHIVEEMKMLKTDYSITVVDFCDDLLMSSKNRAIALSQEIISANLNMRWHCNGRLNYATPDVIKIMKEAGCVYINYGIECFDDGVLKTMNKALTTEQIVKGIKATLEHGVSPGFNIIFGNIDEDEKTLKKSVDFLLEYGDWAEMRTIRPVTPYPGSPLYYYALEKGLLKDAEDFYENKHINSDLLTVNFTKLSDEDFYKYLYEANKKLIRAYLDKKMELIKGDMDKLYCDLNVNFRGFRDV